MAGEQHTMSAERVVSLSNVALCFSAPALEGEFIPVSPWKGGHPVHRCAGWPNGPPGDPMDLANQFAASVERCIGDAETVVVACSGGLDSLAVLRHAGLLCGRARRLVAAVVEMRDDTGHSSSAAVALQTSLLGIPCELKIFDGCHAAGPEPLWDANVLYRSAMPRMTRAVNDFAATLPESVLLTGNGSDELFQSPQYLACTIARKAGAGQALSFLWDVARFEPLRGPLGELGATLSRYLPGRLAFELFQSAYWPTACSMSPPPILHRRFADHVHQWSRDWLRNRAYEFENNLRDWAFTAASNALDPLPVPGASGVVSELSPFLDPAFLEYARRIPLWHRFDGRYRTPYHRHKALVMALYPKAAAQTLPPYKQLYARTLGKYVRDVLADRELLTVELGLLSETTRLTDVFSDMRVARVVYMLENWLAGAVDRGFCIRD